MNKQTVLIASILVALVLGFSGGYAMRGSQVSSGFHMMSNGSMMGDGMMGGNIDGGFIEQMIPHHEGAIEMARIALERSKRPEMITLANNIIKAQEKEIADMRAWYKAWYGTSVPAGGMGMHMGGMTGDADVLKTVPAAEFDREFINQMIPHHEMAVMMAGMLAAGTARQEMKQLASNIIASQSNEIEMMRGWLTSWY